MEKLNELREAFYPQYGTHGSRDMDVTARRKVIDENIEAVAEAFRALEQRAEAAEAKLAELEKQEPSCNHHWIRSEGRTASGWLCSKCGDYDGPATAADMAELVPDKLTADGVISMHDCGVVEGWNDCCDAILRNIEGAK